MQNCPLIATQIASVIALYAENHQIYRALHWNLPGKFTAPISSALILQMSVFVTKLYLYNTNDHC